MKTRKVNKSFRLFDFRANDCNDINDGDNDEFKYPIEKKFYIEMIGINELGQSCSITVTDYLPFFYVLVDDDWDEGNARSLQTFINSKKTVLVENSEIVEYNKLYGFAAGKKSKFVKLTFVNNYAMNKVKNMWYSYQEDTDSETGEIRKDKKQVKFIYQGCDLKIYEANIPPLLRYLHIHKISPSGWISIPIKNVTVNYTKNTTCDYEYICKIKDITPLPDKESIVPYKIMSFDIEAGSSHGDFPVPVKTYKKLSTNIVDIFIKKRNSLKIDSAKTLFNKIVLKSFYENEKIISLKLENIDKVYPKELPTKDELKEFTNKIVNIPVQEITKNNKNNILKISDAFEKKEESDDENEFTKKQKINKKMTVIEMLIDSSNNRDTLINELNNILTSLLPELNGDPVTFIGSTFMKYGEKTPYFNHCIVLNNCENIDNISTECYDTEKEVLLAWKDLIHRENPDIIIGYNIFGFDYEFMFQRAKENKCEKEFLQLSRMNNEICGKMKNFKVDSIENTKIAIASGEYDLKYINMFGRLQIDMYAYFRRDFNLSSYKLDDVSGEYISDDIKKIVHIDNNTHFYTKNITGLNVGDFIHIELVSFTTDHYDNGKKIKVLNILNDVVDNDKKYNVIVADGIYNIDTNKKIKWGMAKDDVTPQDIFRLTKGNDNDRSIVAKYCIQDCNLVHYLMNKIDVITGYVEMSSICSVPINYLVFRGQGIKLTSYVAKKCREKKTLMPDLQKPKNASGYEGAIVLPPKCDMYMDNPVACVDYSSLYPSSMISQNYSHDSKVWTKTYDNDNKLIKITGEKNKKGDFIYDNIDGYEYIDIDFDIFEYRRPENNPKARAEKTKVGRKICRWAQLPNNQKSIMPSILEELLKARKDTRKKIKTENDPFMKNILDKRQLGYKMTANSLYGQCGSKTSTFYEQDVAASTTATGRSMIIYGKRMIEELYGDLEYKTESGKIVKTNAEYIYGDTDSVFFTFNLSDPVSNEKIVGYDALKYTIEIAQEAAELCSQFLKPPMFLEYEKTLMPFILLSKKRYVGMLYEDDPNKGYLKYMGLSIKRRDSCDYLKDTYGEIINILMNESNISSAINFLNKSLEDLAGGNVNTDKLLITKALRGYYKNPQQIAHQVLAERIGKRDPGNKPKPGDRMRYLFYVNNNKKALNGDKIETPEFIKGNKLKIDYSYYVTNQLMKPLQQLFGLAIEKIYLSQNKKASIKNYKSEIEKIQKNSDDDFEIFMKKKEKISSARIKTILFDDILRKINNEKANIKSISSYFT
jgi:DNA polymerase elongation subunit (family B)